MYGGYTIHSSVKQKQKQKQKNKIKQNKKTNQLFIPPDFFLKILLTLKSSTILFFKKVRKVRKSLKYNTLFF